MFMAGRRPKANKVSDKAEVPMQPTGRRPSTVLEEFDRLRQQRIAEWFQKWRGKIHLDIDVDELRGRH
jgi:hypothetical protein